jgi:glycosyltransferase involved in cell wall biosynthesis
VDLYVVTINKDNVSGLRGTIESVGSQSDVYFYWVIVDGASSDGSDVLVRSLPPRTGTYSLTAISEPDSGIYDAMNKGLDYCKSGYVLFLNSGDLLFDGNTLARLKDRLVANELPDIYWGGCVVQGRRASIQRRPKPGHFRGMPGHHQSMVTKVDIHGKFSSQYRFAADYEKFLELRQTGYRFVFEPNPLSVFDYSGSSSIHPLKSLTEANLIRLRFGIAPVGMVSAALHYVKVMAVRLFL